MDGLDGLKGFSNLNNPMIKMRDVKQLGKFSISVGIFKFTLNVCNSSHYSHDRTRDPEWDSLFQILGKSVSLSKYKMPSKLYYC